ncbi:unnamed protein product [Periconia digitata]|uniref:Uncharacterized protein n=1 Tax=Periconia digitata TaxID=1303443 RepID=A0A9W4UGP8_9PLEO|nr:unnamed protein product [Periconia digitata]
MAGRLRFHVERRDTSQALIGSLARHALPGQARPLSRPRPLARLPACCPLHRSIHTSPSAPSLLLFPAACLYHQARHTYLYTSIIYSKVDSSPPKPCGPTNPITFPYPLPLRLSFAQTSPSHPISSHPIPSHPVLPRRPFLLARSSPSFFSLALCLLRSAALRLVSSCFIEPTFLLLRPAVPPARPKVKTHAPSLRPRHTAARQSAFGLVVAPTLRPPPKNLPRQPLSRVPLPLPPVLLCPTLRPVPPLPSITACSYPSADTRCLYPLAALTLGYPNAIPHNATQHAPQDTTRPDSPCFAIRCSSSHNLDIPPPRPPSPLAYLPAPPPGSHLPVSSFAQSTIMAGKMTLYKLVVLGDGGVGKTALTIQLCLNHFVETYDPTIEDSYRKQVQIDGQSCMLEVLDTAGQEEYIALRDQWIRDGEGFVLVYSISSRSSFARIQRFHNQIQRVKETSLSSSPTYPGSPVSASPMGHFSGPAPVMLVGNKCDRVTEREVSTQEGSALAKELGCEFVEASAKNCVNVEKAFFEVVRLLRRQRQGGRPVKTKVEPKDRPDGGRPHPKKPKGMKCVIL